MFPKPTTFLCGILLGLMSCGILSNCCLSVQILRFWSKCAHHSASLPETHFSFFFPTKMECSPSIRQQKTCDEEYSVLLQILRETSWREGDTEDGGVWGRQRVCERWFISFRLYGFFFPCNFAQHAEMSHRSAKSAALDFKVNGYLSLVTRGNLYVRKNKLNVLVFAEALSTFKSQ